MRKPWKTHQYWKSYGLFAKCNYLFPKLFMRYYAWRNARELKKPWCAHFCEWTYPYGFVPEGGCPVHDNYPMPEGL